MARSDNYIGLSEKAISFLNNNCLKDKVVKVVNGKIINESYEWRKEIYNHFEGVYNNKFPLYKYVLLNDKEVFEFIFAEPWSSGPCYFLALKDKNDEIIKESIWNDEEMEIYC